MPTLTHSVIQRVLENLASQVFLICAKTNAF